jgi:hypothetical protein
MLTNYLTHDLIPLRSKMQPIIPDLLSEVLCGVAIRELAMQIKRVAISGLAASQCFQFY